MAGIITAKYDGLKMRLDQLPEDSWKILSGNGASGDAADVKTLFERVPWLNRGVDVCGSTLAQIPFVILNKADEEIDGSEDYQNVTGLWADPFGDLYRAEAALTLFNAAYFLKQRTVGKKARGVRYLVPTTIRPVVDAEKGLTGFIRNVNGREGEPFKLEDLIYIYGPDPYTEAGAPGWSRAIAAMAAAGVLKNVDEFAAAFFERGMIKTTLLAVAGNPGPDALEAINSMWGRIMRGIKTAYRRMVMNADMVTPITIGEGIGELSNTTLNAEKREDIATALGVPHSLLFSNATNFATASQDERNFYNQRLIPDANLIAACFNEQYFDAAGFRLQFRPWEMDLFQEDEEDRTGALVNLVSAAVNGPPAVVRVMFEVMGIELPGGMEYNDFEKLLVKAKKDNEPPKPPPSLDLRPAAGSNEQQDDEPAEPDEEDAEKMVEDFGRWERKAIKRLKSSPTAGCAFDSPHIPPLIAILIEEQLAEATTPQQVRAIFALAEV